MTNMANLIKTSRLAAGKSQTEVSKAFGFKSAQSVSNLERGVATLPAERVSKMAKVLKISPYTLIAAHVKDSADRYERRAKIKTTKKVAQ